MNFYCGHCGSQNHLTMDCTKKHLTFIPPPEPEPEKEVVAVKEKGPIFESKPRWAGGPRICTAENLGAFETEKDIEAHRAKENFTGNIIKKWKCSSCNYWHYIAGNEHPRSSGPIPSYVKYFRRAASVQTSRTNDLPVNKVEPKKKVELPRKEKVKSKEGNLL